jgi:hypothetical protein
LDISPNLITLLYGFNPWDKGFNRPKMTYNRLKNGFTRPKYFDDQIDQILFLYRKKSKKARKTDQK